MTQSRWLIAGLGNPGRAYEQTWHNSGYQVLDRIAGRYALSIERIRFHSLTADWRIDQTRCLLVKPLTYMNLSGEAIREAADYYQITPAHTLVVYDDIDLPLGQIRIRRSGGPGTHNGMRSIVACLQTQDFPRVRVGIGPPPQHWDLADYVLAKVAPEQLDTWLQMIDRAADAVGTAVREGLSRTMSLYNER